MASAPGLDIDVYTDTGRREAQEDYFYTGPQPSGGRAWLGIVADGMGGYEGGAKASQTGVHAIRQAFESAYADETDTAAALEQATKRGQEAVVRVATEDGLFGNTG